MRFGIIILPQEPWAEARTRWQRAEELGFDHAWTYDHLSWRSLADQPWGATLPTLTAAATVTDRIRLGTFVTSPNFRHPVPFAKDLATIDDIAGGRFIIGVGSGVARGFDSFVLGDPEYSPRERHARFTEFVALLDELLRFETPGSGGISSQGEWFTAKDARMVGTPAQSPRIPFAIAANGPKGLSLVARYGQGWITNGPDGVTGEDWWRTLGEYTRRLEDAAAQADRDPAEIDRYLSLDSGGNFALDSIELFEEMTGRAAELGFTDVVAHWPRAEGIYAGSEDVLFEVGSRLDALR